MKNIFQFVFIFGLGISGMAQEEIRFMNGSLSAILSIAKDNNKNVFIDTYASWCVPCKRMDKVFKDPEVARFYNEHFINLKVNMQNEKRANELRKYYDVVFLPTLIIVDPEGRVKYQIDRELSKDEMLNIGQLMLDPTRYNISDATAIRRNDGTVVGNMNKTYSSSSSITQTPVRHAKKNSSKNKSVTTTGSSTSQATNRAKYLEQFETVEESSQKVLYVLGPGETPGDVLAGDPNQHLKQEAYLRLEFMDGTHRNAAKKYLATQVEWNTPENRKFIYDFVSNTESDEFKFMVAHRNEFEEQYGVEKIHKTFEVLVYRALHNQVPRPDLNQSIELYSLLDKSTAEVTANQYFINRLISEKRYNDAIDASQQYFSRNTVDHQMRYQVAEFILDINPSDKDQLEYALQIMKETLHFQKEHNKYSSLIDSINKSLQIVKDTISKNR